MNLLNTECTLLRQKLLSLNMQAGGATEMKHCFQEKEWPCLAEKCLPFSKTGPGFCLVCSALLSHKFEPLYFCHIGHFSAVYGLP
jgi:hypothetical protein